MINLNEWARDITIVEGLKKNTNIAQVKEVMRHFIRKLKNATMDEVATLLKRYK